MHANGVVDRRLPGTGLVAERLAILRKSQQNCVWDAFMKVRDTPPPKFGALEQAMGLREDADVVALGMAVERRLAPMLPQRHKLLPVCVLGREQ